MSKHKPVDQIKMFQKYALRLVDAAIEPIRTGSDVILEGGSECLSGIDVYSGYVNTFDGILATISIAKHYHEHVKVIKNTSESGVSGIIGKIPAGMMDNIRLILVVLQTPQAQIDQFSENKMLKKYLLKRSQGSTSAAGSSNNKKYPQKHFKCLRTLLGVDTNENFFGVFARGLRLIRELMTGDNKGDRSQVDMIIDRVSKTQVERPPVRTDKEIEEILDEVNTD